MSFTYFIIGLTVAVTVSLLLYFFVFKKSDTVVVVSETPIPPPSVPWLSMTGYDYVGNDMTGSPFIDITQDKCTELCKTTSGCIAAQYNPTIKQCWLKNKLGGASANANQITIIPPLSTTSPVSSWKKLTNQDIGGSDIACYTDGSSVDKCSALCALHGDCKSYNEVNSSIGGVWSKGGCCVKMKDTNIAAMNGVNIWTK